MDFVSSLRAAGTPILGELISPRRSSDSKEPIVTLFASALLWNQSWLFFSYSALLRFWHFAGCKKASNASDHLHLPLGVFLKAFQGRRAYARWPHYGTSA